MASSERYRPKQFLQTVLVKTPDAIARSTSKGRNKLSGNEIGENELVLAQEYQKAY